MSSTLDVADRLDCRRMAAHSCPAAVLDTFDGLAAGRRVRIVCAAAPDETLEALRRERRGAFEWSPVREGPHDWQVDVERRAAPVGSLRGVTEALAWDHARLDALEAAAFEARAGGGLAQARELLADFAHGLRRHIDFEEQLLFPELESRCRLMQAEAPTRAMRSEHRAILAHLGVMETQIDDRTAPIELRWIALRAIQRDHDLKEELIFYPALDRLLDAEEGDRVVARIQAWPRG
jgi:uncharacterized protein (DUF2249 family)